MTVQAVTGSTVSTPTETTNRPEVNYDTFLQLLVSQLQNQNPLEPTDAAQQLSQLAAFSNVEQTIQINEKIGALQSMNSLQLAANMIGRTIQTPQMDTPASITAVHLEGQELVAELDSGAKIPLSGQFVIR